jgi:hypothetical protein
MVIMVVRFLVMIWVAIFSLFNLFLVMVFWCLFFFLFNVLNYDL